MYKLNHSRRWVAGSRARKLLGFFRTAAKNEMRSEARSANRTVIRRGIRYNAAVFLAMLAIVLQALLPGTLAVAGSNGVDVSRFICASSGQLSVEAKAAIEEFAKLVGDEAPDRQPFDGHCPLCTLVHVMPLPEPVTVAAPAELALVAACVCYEPGVFVQKAEGPPLGSRGPPLHL